MARKLDKQAVARLAVELGFSDCRFTKAQLPPSISNDLAEFIQLGYHGSMDWMAQTFDRRASPNKMWNEAKSAIVLAMNYGPEDDPRTLLEEKDCGVISVYARNRDYHDVIKGRLKQIAQQIAVKNNCDVKVFVDTAPLMEKPLAFQAGLGWQGKHTNVVSRALGSWFFLGVILTDFDLEADEGEIDHCGSCKACLENCPTNAFPQAYKIDARRCISYLTIEHDGFIDPELRALMGNRIYGCDDCLAACPWNKFAQAASEIKLQARPELTAPKLAQLVRLDDADFRKFFSRSPVKRIGHDRFVRNVLIAIGNSNLPEFVEVIKPLLGDQSPMVRGMAIWALARLLGRDGVRAISDAYRMDEDDHNVLLEWRAACGV